MESGPGCELSGSIDISRTPEDVWSFLGDFEDVEVPPSSNKKTCSNHLNCQLCANGYRYKVVCTADQKDHQQGD